MKWLGNFVFVDILITRKPIALQQPSMRSKTFPNPTFNHVCSEQVNQHEKHPLHQRQVFLTAHIEEEMVVTMSTIRTHGRLKCMELCKETIPGRGEVA